MAIRYVSFDFDNTLLRSEDSKSNTMRELCGRYEPGLEILSDIPTDSRTAPPGTSVTRHTIFAAFASGLHERGVASDGESAEEMGKRLCDEFSVLVQQRLAEAEEVSGAAALLAHLSQHGLPCCVNSATPAEPLEEIVRARGWAAHFRAVFGAPGTKVENLWLAARTLNLRPEEILHVGDGDNDRKAAREFGCPFIGVSDTPDGPDGAWAGASFPVVPDMRAAAVEICKLTGLPDLPEPSSQQDQPS